MSSSSANASIPAYPPPTKTKVSADLRSAGSGCEDATSSRSSTLLRKAIASSTFLNPVASSASPGIGRVRAIEPIAITTWS